MLGTRRRPSAAHLAASGGDGDDLAALGHAGDDCTGDDVEAGGQRVDHLRQACRAGAERGAAQSPPQPAAAEAACPAEAPSTRRAHLHKPSRQHAVDVSCVAVVIKVPGAHLPDISGVLVLYLAGDAHVEPQPLLGGEALGGDPLVDGGLQREGAAGRAASALAPAATGGAAQGRLHPAASAEQNSAAWRSAAAAATLSLQPTLRFWSVPSESCLPAM